MLSIINMKRGEGVILRLTARGAVENAILSCT